MGDKVIKKTNSAYKYENPFRGRLKKGQKWTNGTVIPRTGTVTMIINIRDIRPYNTPNVQGRDPL